MSRKPGVINQFIWGYQAHFRMSVEHSVRNTFKEIGFESKVSVVLVGFEAAGEHVFPICIEPEEGPYSPDDFAGVKDRAQQLYEQHPESKVFNTDPRVHENRQRGILNEMRAQAIAEVLTAHEASAGRSFFGGMSTRVADYDVHVVIGARTAALEKVPQLRTTRRDRYRVSPSFLHALLDEILEKARMALYLPNPGSGFGVLEAETDEIVRAAADRFVRGVLLCAGFYFNQDSNSSFSAISALPYEGRSGLGFLLLARPDNPAIEVTLRLGSPVRLGSTRAVRKLLEASGGSVGLLTGELKQSFGGSVFGLGSVRADYDALTEAVFTASIMGRGAWDLEHDGKAMLSVRDGIARLPSRTFSIAVLQDVIERVLPGADVDRLISLAVAAEQHDHGAMLVISAEASAEASRLSPQAWSVDPVDIEPQTLWQLTAMDGAVLVDPQGRCHAIGVILDGRANDAGDPSRGSRYNNTVRYMGSDPPPCVVVVYSSDRTVDIFPQMMPRVARAEVEQALDRYLRLAAERPPHLEWTYEAREDLAEFRFYLSKEQCDLVNTAVADLNNWRMSDHGMSIGENVWRPNPDMNSSYWLD